MILILRVKQLLTFLSLPWLLLLLIQSFSRFYLLYSNVSFDDIARWHDEVIRLFVVGLGFDIRVSSIACAGLMVVTLFSAVSKKAFYASWHYLAHFSTILVLIIACFSLVNIFYITTYGRYIDNFIFGLIDDDTIAIIKTIWLDYPVITGTLGLVLLGYFVFKWCQRWQVFIMKQPWLVKLVAIDAVVIPLSLILVAIGIRGSLGVFPLRQSDAQVSDHVVINQCVPNGVIAFYWAYKNYRDDQFITISAQDKKEAMITFFNKEIDSVFSFVSRTAKNPMVEKSPPHVVLSIMESMGRHLFEFDNNERDLFGSLRTHWQNDWLFYRFISEGDGTIDSLARFFVRSPIDKISQSSSRYSHFISNMFTPFKQNGYKIIFITPGNGSWRNLNDFLLHLGVDEFVEQNTLLKQYPDAKVYTWGVDDKYMFKYAAKRLSQAEKSGDHLMIMMVSVSNHPPYSIPRDHHYINYVFTPSELKRLKNLGSESKIKDIFNTFRYSNQQLGDFIHWIKSTKLADHTILAATGDHNLRGISYNDPTELVLGHAVPLYLYVPEKYRVDTQYDKTRVGSHKDIMPTLYSLSLSDTAFYQTGCNLVANQLDSVWCNVGYNPQIVIDKEGTYSLSDGYFSPWKKGRKEERNEQTTLLLQDKLHPMPLKQRTVLARWKSWTTLMYWQLNQQIINSQKYKIPGKTESLSN